MTSKISALRQIRLVSKKKLPYCNYGGIFPGATTAKTAAAIFAAAVVFRVWE